MLNHVYCFFLKSKTLRNCLSSSSFIHCFSGLTGNSEQKNILQTFEQLMQFSYLLLWKGIFLSILFLNKPQQMGIPQSFLNKCSHLFICVSLKQTLSNGQNCQNCDIRLNSPCCRVLICISFCFLQVNQQKYIGMVSLNNM